MGTYISKSYGTASGGSAKGSLTLANGERIEFDGELKFGRDSGVSGAAREQIEKWENKRRSNKIEFAYAVTQQGEVLGETRGGKKGVVLTKQMKETENSIVTHIHPRGYGDLGGVFSQADMVSWTRNNMKTMRAVSKEGTYSISKQSNFNSKGFLEMFSEDDNKRRAEYIQRGNKIVSDYKARK